MVKRRMIFMLVGCLLTSLAFAQQKLLWEIGKADNSSTGMALAPADYTRFLEADFGWDDRFFLIGHSAAEKDWPYAMPGPADAWGGTGPTSGLRSQVLNILFGLAGVPINTEGNLVIDLLGYNGSLPPLVKVVVNGKSKVIQLPKRSDDGVLTNKMDAAKAHKISIPVKGLLKAGGNEIQLSSLAGSWLVFDQVKLEGAESLRLKKPTDVFVRNVKAASYELQEQGKSVQPLLLDVQHLRGKPALTVKLDGKLIFSEKLDTSRYEFEVPMPAVSKPKTSQYEIFSDGQSIEKGAVRRAPGKIQTFADYVDTKLGSAHSRWMIAPGPWMPFGMVKLSPGTFQVDDCARTMDAFWHG